MLMTKALDTLEKDTWNYGCWYDKDGSHRHRKVTLREVLGRLEKKHRRKAVVTGRTRISVQGVVVPNELEWQQMK